MKEGSFHVLHISSRGDFGGGPEHIYRLCEGMLKTSHHISSFVALPRDVPYWGRFVSLLGVDNCLEIPHRKFSLAALLKLISFAKKKKINVVHSHGKGASTLARPLVMVSRGKYIGVHTPHGIHISQYGKVSFFIYRIYENLTSRLGTHHVIYVSASEQEKASTSGLWKSCSHSMILNGVPAGIDIYKMCIPERSRWISNRRIELGLPLNSFLVTSIARFSPEKNMEATLKIAQQLPQLTFIWIGDGPQLEEIKNEVLNRNIQNIIFTGFRQDAGSYLPISDAYLSTSLGEGLPLTMLEAMANGLPIVGSDVVGNRDIMSLSDDLFAFPLSDLGVAVQFLERLSTDASIRERSSRSSLYIQQSIFSLESMIKRTSLLYQKILN